MATESGRYTTGAKTEPDRQNGQNYDRLGPGHLDVGKEACLARIALEAKLFLVIAPPAAVAHGWDATAGRYSPRRLIHIRESTG
jgi:hypothetical protein